MPLDTRSTLKIFGVTVTGFEDFVKEVLPKAQSAERAGDAKELLRLVTALSEKASQVNMRLAEVTEMIAEMQKKAYQELLQTLKAI